MAFPPLLALRLGTEAWKGWRDHLAIQFLHLDQAGLSHDAKDDFVWRFCQEHGFYLLTANRNRKSEDSLEATIRREGKADSIPIFTFADAEQIFQSLRYLDEVLEFPVRCWIRT